jgi:hypothetical protein
MDEKQKKEELKRIPTRQLVASIKRDIRRVLSASAAPKSKRKK